MDRIEIVIFKNNPIDSNCYLIIDNKERKALIIDPGCEDCGEIIDYLNVNNISPDFILLTHEHFDHIWGINDLKNRFNSKTICSNECADRIIDRKKNLSVFYNQIGFCTPQADILFYDSISTFEWYENKIKFIKTKGHSEGSSCFLINNYLFTGDTIIKNQKTILKLPESNKTSLIGSLELIATICDNNTVLLPGHGESFFYNYTHIKDCIQ